MFLYYDQCLEGEAKRQFERLKNQQTSKTAATLKACTQQLTMNFFMKDILIHQQQYMRYKLKKPFDKTVCEFVYAETTLNNQLGKLPPSFNDTQKIQDSEFLYAVHENAEKEYKDIVKFHGFQLGNGNTDDYIEMCERASQDDCSESSGDEYARKQTSRKKKIKEKAGFPIPVRTMRIERTAKTSSSVRTMGGIRRIAAITATH